MTNRDDGPGENDRPSPDVPPAEEPSPDTPSPDTADARVDERADDQPGLPFAGGGGDADGAIDAGAGDAPHGEPAAAAPTPAAAPVPAPRPAVAPVAAPAVAAAVEGEESFGRWLRRQRVVREIDLREIADSSKISLRYLQALEDERFDLLPAPVFAKGFLRQYARYVGIDPEEVVNFFQAARRRQLEEKEDSLAALMGEPPQRSKSNLLYGVLVLLVVVGLVALVWWLTQLHRDRQEAQRQAEAPSAAAAAAGAAPAASAGVGAEVADDDELTGPLRATLDFNGECWVEAWSDGERQLTERHVQGESLRLDADSELILNLGDVTVVELEINGHPYRPGEGTPQRWLRFTREQLGALERGAPIEALDVPVGEGSPRRAPPPPPTGSAAAAEATGATGAAA